MCKIKIAITATILVASPFFIFSAHADTISINPNLPGVEGATDLVSIVVNIYQTALLVGAFLAFGSIVYGAATYALAEAGFAKSEARERITNAVIGLLLLAAAYLLLYTINPALTILTNPGLEEVAVVKSGAIPSGGIKSGGGGGNRNICKPAKSGTPCDPENFKNITGHNGKQCNWDPNKMSTICQAENSNRNICSDTDRCGDGTSWSCGLMQINMTDASGKPASCNGAVISNGTNPPPGRSCDFSINSALNQQIGCCLDGGHWKTGSSGGKPYCNSRNCVAGTNYNQCKNDLLNITENLKYACDRFQSQQYQAWERSNADAIKCGYN